VPATGPDPTFSYPGDPECSITYGSNQAGTTTWAATVTESGELITHALDNQGDINRRDAQVTSGPNSFTAPEPLNDIGDVGGVLYVGSPSYGCSIAPAKYLRRPRQPARRALSASGWPAALATGHLPATWPDTGSYTSRPSLSSRALNRPSTRSSYRGTRNSAAAFTMSATVHMSEASISG
jgi:hypothetical protein